MIYQAKKDIFVFEDEHFNSRPVSICLTLGYYCNLNCDYCLNPKVKRTDKNLQTSDSLFELIKIWSPLRVVLTGGEPSLYPKKLDDIGTALKGLGNTVIVATNGHDVSKLGEMDWIDRVAISLPGMSKRTYKIMRNFDGFDRTVKGIEYFVKKGKDVSINFTVSSHNISEAGNVVGFARNIGASVLAYEVIYKIGHGRDYEDFLSKVDFRKAFTGVTSSANLKVLFPAVGKSLQLVKNGLIAIELNGNIYRLATEPEYMVANAEAILSGKDIPMYRKLTIANKHLFSMSEKDIQHEFWKWCEELGET